MFIIGITMFNSGYSVADNEINENKINYNDGIA